MKKLSLGKAAAAVTAGLMLASTFAMPVAAVADTGSTDFTIQAAPNVDTSNPDNPKLSDADKKIALRVPSVIPFAAKADGTLVGPTADKVKVSNESAFGIQVTGVMVKAVSGWNIVEDPNAADVPNNSFNFQLTAGSGQGALTIDAYDYREIYPTFGATLPDYFAGRDTSDIAELGYTHKGGSHDSTEFNSTGLVRKMTSQGKTAEKVATITWRVATK